MRVPASLTLLPSPDTLRSLGAINEYTAVVKDASGSVIAGAVVSWTSTNATVVSVDAAGRAKAVSNGSAFVRAQSASAVDSVLLVVSQRIDPRRSALSVVRPLLFVGDTARVTLQARDALDNPVNFGGASVVFTQIGGPSSGTFDATLDRGNGTYTSNFVGSAVGTADKASATVNGTPISTAMPTLRVIGFTKIAANSVPLTLSCGIITTGDLYCWGEQNRGARGTGVVNVTTAAATLVTGGHRWTHIDIGSGSVCGITESAKLYCWGDSFQGSLGIGAASGYYPAPMAVLPESSFVAVDLGLTNAHCAITTGHAAMCWSLGIYGRLGNGADTTAYSPVAVSGGNRFAGIGTSEYSTCGVTDAGIAMCWGSYITLGIGPGPYPETCDVIVPCVKTPVPVAGSITFKPTTIVEDGSDACAIGTNNKTYCWGLWDNVPTELSGAPVFTSLAKGYLDSCGVAQGGLAYCWGTNTYSRFGGPRNPNEMHRVPEPVVGGKLFTQLSMGPWHMCGIATDGNAWCWGNNIKGELGDGTLTPSTTPVRVRLFVP